MAPAYLLASISLWSNQHRILVAGPARGVSRTWHVTGDIVKSRERFETFP
jgi:hypothetical protein